MHPHGEHTCVCPECGYETEVSEGDRCREISCPVCEQKMRAKEPGELYPERR